jgi:NAD-dependent protein deacetylase/lipoamidase
MWNGGAVGARMVTASEAVASARRIAVLTGAGVSTASGLPAFRDPNGTALLDPDLADPEARRTTWRARLDHPVWTAEPNAAHRALADLERSGRLRALLTQNVDGLHQRAGSTAVVELHGSIHGVVCAACGARGPMADALARVRAGEPDPACPVCGGVLRSTTVSFGDPLDAAVLRAARTAALDCDLMLVAGTSLLVAPAADLVGLAARAGAAVVICNTEPTPFDALATAVVRDPVAEALPVLVAAPVVESDRPVRTWGDPSTW